jgi:hypothetical protein
MRRYVMLLASTCILSLGILTLAGCEERERVLEIDTPGGGLQIDRVEESDGVQIDIQASGDDNE